MKKIGAFATMVAMMVVVILFSSLYFIEPSKAFGESTQKILMIPREGNSPDPDLMIKEEVGVMIKVLNEAGYDVHVATASGQPIVGPTQKVENILKLQNINVDDYAGVIMPCMAVGLFQGPAIEPKVVSTVKKVLADGKPVAAALGAVNVLAEAGVLKGKKYSYVRDPLSMEARWGITDPRFADAIYIGPGTTQDGNIITCGVCPYTEKMNGWGVDAFDPEGGTIKLTKAFIAALGSGKERVAAVESRH